MKTILFPHTEIFSIRQFPLFLLAQKMQIFQPAVREKQPELLDCFMKAGFCQVMPLPFAENDEERRFLQLAKELHSRNDGYPRQLADLILAARTGVQEDGEQSDRTIRNILYEESLATKQEKRKKREESWQARLILVIGEIIDRQEEEIAVNLARIASSGRRIIGQLQGEAEENEKELLYELQEIEKNLPPAQSQHMRKRAEAWLTLCSGQVEKGDILLSTSRDAVEHLLVTYERVTGNPCHVTEGLPLPLHIGQDSETAMHHCNTFFQQYKTLQEELCTAEWREGFHASWNKAMATTFPVNQYGRQTLKMVSFGDSALQECKNIDQIFLVQR